MEFVAKGSIIRQAGWRAVYGKENGEENNKPEETAAIPDWKEGDTLALKAASITEGKTKPKPLHTEATLLSAMETAGKEIEDDALRQAMKDCGIGTPATRAAIIETLFKRGYMERCKKSLVPTEKGLALYSVVKAMRIADVAMTGEWEKELARIERGELPADDFRKEIEAYTREILPNCSHATNCSPAGFRLQVPQVRDGNDAVLRQGGTLRQHGVRTSRVPPEGKPYPLRR